MFRLIALSLAFALAMPVVAAPADSPAAAPQTATPVVKEKKTCRTESSTGSIMPRRTCRTQAEWDTLGAANRDSLDKMRDRQRRGQMVQGGGVQ